MWTKSKKLSLCFAVLLLTACASIPLPQLRYETASQLAASHNWQAKRIQTQQFDLLSYRPKVFTPETELTVYIEGDGLAWLNMNTVSSDPTPVNPTGLKLAFNHPKGNAAYLARPCQYMGGSSARNCSKHEWTDSRFSEEAIKSSNQALSSLKAEFNATKLQLIGFSGGGAIAALLAARRDDVTKLITVAGNLDHRAWTSYHKISPLLGSLNPIDYRQQLAKVNQIHIVGDDDKVMPAFIARDFIAGLPSQTNTRLIVVPKQTHNCCWDKLWADLITQNKLL